MSAAPFERFLDYRPDHIEGSAAHTHMLRVWMPTEEQGGLAIVDYNQGDKTIGRSPFEGINLLENVQFAANTIRRLATELPELYHYLETYAEQDYITRAIIQFPHSKTFIRKLGALPLADEHAPPVFILEEGNVSATTSVTNLCEKGAFTMASDGPYAAHDLIAHDLSAQMLVARRGMHALQKKFSPTLALGKAAIAEAADSTDRKLSYVVYGAHVAQALRYNKDGYQGKAYWSSATAELDPSCNTVEIAEATRTYCLALEDAARIMNERQQIAFNPTR